MNFLYVCLFSNGVGRPINCARGWWSLSGTKGWRRDDRPGSHRQC